MFQRRKPNSAAPVALEGEMPVPSDKTKRPLLVRLFSLKFWGAVRLTALCVLVGLIQNIGWAEKQTKDFDVMSTIQTIWENTFQGLIWVIKHGWQPALLGATIVIPIWVIWRLISLPFRK